ncbi:hypothetical protein [Lignipirellula cremea]|uniref:YHS domain protein n=1 Tax=Lignipirellula cremea TaxID=2528010 RepID=A0A518DT08_9BACT|nr:hypothetical protein [Lignipirellula cremea]QDU94967.1 YHS domain protein [Lignipirellula cremea]
MTTRFARHFCSPLLLTLLVLGAALHSPQPAAGQAAGGGAAQNRAFSGYCPVTLREKTQWAPGNAQFRLMYDGREYLFVGQNELNQFRQNPLRYAACLGGDCIVTFVELGERVPGNLSLGVIPNIPDTRYHFFANEAQKKKFAADFDTYVNQGVAKYINKDVALNGNCPVVLKTTGQVTPGRPELAALYRDFRFFCSTPEHRAAFMASPEKYADAQLPPTQQQGATAPAAQPKLALEGFCPVAIVDRRAWVEGNEASADTFDGQIYLFATTQERTTFSKNQFRYAPVLGGDCIVTYANSGARVAGSVYHSAFFRDRLFLFPSDEHKRAFKENPAAYANVDLAYNGACIVSKLNLRQDLAGDPQFGLMHNGLRYQFASADLRAVFQANPDRYAVRPQAR